MFFSRKFAFGVTKFCSTSVAARISVFSVQKPANLRSFSANLSRSRPENLLFRTKNLRLRSSLDLTPKSRRMTIASAVQNGSNAGSNVSMSTAAAQQVVTSESAATCLASIRTTIDDIIKSPEDKREYRALVLQNGMKVFLVSDPSTDKSAAAMNVNVGTLKDPRELPGLAHFCEHMLFLGTEKYPSENEYFKFLSAHGGGANAFTASDHTCYFFDIAPDHLEGALDRFAQFFRAPLFTESATEREVNAVDSENKNNLQNDMWRLMQLEKALSNPKHDYSKFGTGNKQTLLDDAKAKGLNTRDELLKFHKEHYSSNQMGLCILGKQSLDQLAEMILTRFADVENKSIAKYEWPEHPWGAEQKGKCVNVVPVKDLRSLHITFPTPDLHPHYKTQPGHYLGHLLGHEGPGSLLSELKRRGWVNALVGGPREGATGFAFFCVDVDLSEEGMEHVEDILDLLFQYLHMIQQNGVQKWIHDECRSINELKFRFKDKERPQRYAQHLSTVLHEYPLNEALYGGYIMDEYKPELIRMVLDLLIPENVTYFVVSKQFEGKEGNLKEKWYGTEYSMKEIDPALLARLKEVCHNCEELKLPERNEFIPDKFELKPRENGEKHPEIIRDDTIARVWYKQDDEFKMPKRCLFFTFTSPLTYQDPFCTNLAHMYVTMLSDELTEFTYDASLAGLRYGMENGRYGVSLSISGYDQKQEILLEKLVEKMVHLDPDPKRFEVLKELYVRSLRNFKQEQPYQHAVYYTSYLLTDKSWSKDELLETVEGLTLENLKDYAPRVLANLHIEALVHGNSTKEEALKLVAHVESILKKNANLRPLFASQMAKDRELEIPRGQHFAFDYENSTHANSAVEMLLQTGVQSGRENMLLELLCQVVNEPAFDTLRTKESLGYIVATMARRSNGTQGFRVIIQGEKDPDFVEARVELFLKKMRDTISEMSAEEFTQNIEALATKRLEKPKRLSALAVRFWSEIGQRQYHFDRDDDEVSLLRELKKEDLLAYYDRVIALGAPERRKLSVRVFSTNAKERLASGDVFEDPDFVQTKTELIGGPAGDSAAQDFEKVEKIKNVQRFKAELPVYPRAKPHLNITPGGLQDPGTKSMI